MNKLFASNRSRIGARASDVVRRARRRIVRGADFAVIFVLDSVGIKIEPDHTLWQNHVMVQMTVLSACGRFVGCVEEIGDNFIKLANTDGGSGRAKFIPWDWVERVDSYVCLNRDYEEVTGNV
jgi:hypothetical protein